MASHSQLLTTEQYVALLARIDERLTDLAQWLDGTGTDLPAGAIKWDSAAKKWKKWSGTTWADLAAEYEIPTKAANCSIAAITGLSGTTVQAALASLNSIIPSGTKMLFQQTAAPTGWTKQTTNNNKALRVVSGTAGSGGTVEFTTAFANRTVTSTTAGGTVGATTLSVDQMPSHLHGVSALLNAGGGGGAADIARWDYSDGTRFTHLNGGGLSHDHAFTGNSHNHTLNMAVQYVDVIIASRNYP
jgi:hypothetical protein